MTSATARRRRSRPSLRNPSLALALVATLGTAACASFVEVPIETPLQSKLDVSGFRRVLVAGFVADAGGLDIDLSSETSRLLQNQLRSNGRLQVLEPDRPPLHDQLDRLRGKLADPASKAGREALLLDADRVLLDTEYWRKLGEEYQTPLFVTGKLSFAEQNRSGFQADERVQRDPVSGRQRVARGNRYLERKGFSLSADFQFIDGKTGQLVHKEKFTEEVLYSDDQRISPLSAYFELMDRLLPNFLGVIAPQRIRGTRVLLP